VKNDLNMPIASLVTDIGFSKILILNSTKLQTQQPIQPIKTPISQSTQIMDADNKKRKSEGPNDGHAKKSKQWRTPKKGQHSYTAPSIEAGDAGIWATCEMGKEGKCTGELRDLFEEYAAKIYGNSKSANEEDGASDDYDAEVDIEAEIKAELEGMKASGKKKQPLFQAVKVDIQCVLFFKTHPPIEPVSFVHAICKDALEGGLKRGRWVKKLMPMTMMGKATPEGLGNVAERVLGPVFHTKPSEGEGQREGLRFAIRPTRRNHNVMKRDEIIRQVAAGVGRGHRVDLKNYDYLILVDVYRVSPPGSCQSPFPDVPNTHKSHMVLLIHDAEHPGYERR